MSDRADFPPPGPGAAIEVAGLGKAYKRYANKWARLGEWLTGRDRHEKHWVLRDIAFQVGRGEAVGIIGVNGAGKSTLLKIITGTTQPTCGSVRINGRVAALLELGMGFHPDFTGRQNVFTAGQLQGMSIGEIEAAFADIEAFADIGDYIDQPVRTYSSGMQVRLAFAVATAARPDILIVDEALAVGDALFQRKCFQRIEEFRASGTTLLFVSHDIESVKRLCDRALFLSQGQLEMAGTAKEVCDAYEERLFGRGGKGRNSVAVDASLTLYDSSLAAALIERQYGEGGAKITDVAIQGKAGQSINVISEGEPFSIAFRVAFGLPACGVRFGMMIKSLDGVCIYATNTQKWSYRQDYGEGDVVSVRFDLQGNLVPGTYYLNVGATRDANGGAAFLQRRVDCLVFRVVSAHWRTTAGYANMFATPVVELVGDN